MKITVINTGVIMYDEENTYKFSWNDIYDAYREKPAKFLLPTAKLTDRAFLNLVYSVIIYVDDLFARCPGMELTLSY